MKTRAQHFNLELMSRLLLFLIGIGILSAGLLDLSWAQTAGTNQNTQIVFDVTKIQEAICDLLSLIEGSFGALLMIVAGIGAIMAAAVGSYSAAMSMLVVGCGSFILRSFISLWFGPVDYCGQVGTVKLPGQTSSSSGGIGPVQTTPPPPGTNGNGGTAGTSNPPVDPNAEPDWNSAPTTSNDPTASSSGGASDPNAEPDWNSAPATPN